MKKIFKITILLCFLFADFISFAQLGGGPGDEDNNGIDGLEGGDPLAAVINGKLWIFIVLGIVYAFLVFKKLNEVKNPRE
jgi:hypothetical protein